jgi:uncharacterized membrane protein YkvA (DUF1232 family)
MVLHALLVTERPPGGSIVADEVAARASASKSRPRRRGACGGGRANTPKLDAEMSSLLIVGVCLLVVYAAFVVALIVAGRGRDARDVARFIPDCIVFVGRLVGDPRVPRRHKLLLGALAGYLAFPIDLVPDFVPVAGHIDDVLAVVLALRVVLRSSRGELVREHWPGPGSSLAFVLRFVGASSPVGN